MDVSYQGGRHSRAGGNPPIPFAKRKGDAERSERMGCSGTPKKETPPRVHRISKRLVES